MDWLTCTCNLVSSEVLGFTLYDLVHGLLWFSSREKGGFWRFAGLGLEPPEFFGQGVGYEGLAGGDSVDATYFLNGLFQKIL